MMLEAAVARSGMYESQEGRASVDSEGVEGVTILRSSGQHDSHIGRIGL